MERKANIKLELKTLTPIRMAALMRLVASGLEGNAHFPNPPISAAQLKAEELVFTEAIVDATNGSQQSRKQRDALMEQARIRMRYLADYVRMVAQGDAAILTTSGFELARLSGPPQPMATPQPISARKTDRPGEVEFRWSGVANRRTYNVFMTDTDPMDPNAVWVLIAVTGKNTHRVQGLVAYKPYWFQVSAVGALGEGARSNTMLGRAA